MNYTKILLFVFVVLTSIIDINATHNRAGDISFVQTGPLTIEATITLYTKTSSIAADRDSVVIFWGDGSSEFLVRKNGFGDPQPNDVKISYYVGSHTFPSRASYTISMWDPNRIAGILNVNFPSSENIPFYLETTFSFLNTQFQGENNSVVLLQPPIDIGCVGEIFKYNPNAFDIDGDSISYELIIPYQAENTPVPDYKWPDAIASGANNNFEFDTETGDLYWESPQKAGEYNVAFRVNEYRNGKLITSIIRDMQILILDNCQSKPPEIKIDKDVCMLAGDTLKMYILVSDPEIGQKVSVNATGEPFISQFGLAKLENNNVFLNQPYSTKFTWETTCEHVAKTYYQVLFKAMDNSISSKSGLTDIKILKVKVSGDSPKSLKAKYLNSSIDLVWDYPYNCINSFNDYFRGFSVWRKENSNNFSLDTCNPGLEGKGYKIIKYLTNENNGINYTFKDTVIEKGKIYCYRILAEFAHKTFNDFPYNPVQSLASNEACELVIDDAPLLTKVDVLETNKTNGEIEINWIKPDISKFDTIKNSPPYIYHLFKTEGLENDNFKRVDNFEVKFNDYFSQDTFRYLDKGINTEEIQHKYAIKLYTNDNLLHSTSIQASSIFLKAEGADKKIVLDFYLKTPWTNTSYQLFKLNNNNGQFEFLTKTTNPNFIDNNVINGKKYCYYVKSLGTIGSNDFDIINNSQINCTVPIDNEKPCTLSLAVKNDCSDLSMDITDIYNKLSWKIPNDCGQINDIKFYNIYNSKNKDSLFVKLMTINDPEKFDTIHLATDFSGCYYITAVDFNGNESVKSNVVCAENCPLYSLPNTFTPNNDKDNDFYVPRIRRHIDKIDFKVFNQWGILVYQTSDPKINWDGNSLSGQKLNTGTYYYTCKPYSNDIELELLKGYIEIIF